MWAAPFITRPAITVGDQRKPAESGQACVYTADCPACGSLAVFTTRRLPTNAGYEQVVTDVQCDCLQKEALT